MKIKGAKREKQATVLEIETGDPKHQHFHVIPDGVLEDRQAAWGLASLEDALDLVLLEAVEEDPVPAPADVTSRTKAKAGVMAKVKKANVDWSDVDRAQVAAKAAVPPKTRDAIAKHVAAVLGDEPVTMAESIAKHHETMQNVADGYKRRQEEILADEFVSAMPSYQRAMPRDASGVDRSQPVESGITYVP